MKNHTDARIKRSQESIVKSGLVLLNRNFETSMIDIAKHADIGRATLYRLFKNKEQLIKVIALECYVSIDKATEYIDKEATSGLGAIKLLIEAIVPLSEQLQFLLNLDKLNDEDPELNKIYKNQRREMIELVHMAKSEGSIDSSLPDIWILEVFEGLLYSAMVLVNENGFSKKQVSKLMFRTFHQGISLPPT